MIADAPILESIHIHPVKSLGAVEVDEAVVSAAGLRGDRRWMVVDGQDVFLTRRKVPAMAGLGVEDHGDSWMLRHAAFGGVRLPKLPKSRSVRQATIWGEAVPVADGPVEVSRWLSEVFGFSCRIVHLEDGDRTVDPDYGQTDDVVSLADGYPILLTTRASLDDLNGRLASPISMRRFRPNLVVSGVSAFAEDAWRSFSIGPVPLENVKPCGRCVVVDLDPDTGERAGDVLRTLAGYRRFGSSTCFGVNVIPRGIGRLRVGDTLSVIKPL